MAAHALSRFHASRVRTTSLLAIFVLGAALACNGTDSTSPSTPASISIVSGDKETLTVATAPSPPLVVKVTGGGGAALSGAAVTWTLVTGGGKLDTTITTTGTDGTTQAPYTAGTVAGAAQVSASAGNLFPQTFNLTLKADAPASVVAANGDGAAALVGTSLPIYAKVVDQYGNAVANVSVSWVATNGGAVSAATSVSDVNGRVSTTLTLGSVAQIYLVTASSGTLAPATFHVTGI